MVQSTLLYCFSLILRSLVAVSPRVFLQNICLSGARSFGTRLIFGSFAQFVRTFVFCRCLYQHDYFCLRSLWLGDWGRMLFLSITSVARGLLASVWSANVCTRVWMLDESALGAPRGNFNRSWGVSDLVVVPMPRRSLLCKKSPF